MDQHVDVDDQLFSWQHGRATTSPVFTPMAPPPQADYEAGTGLCPGRPDGITVVAPAVTIDQAMMATRKVILPATV